MFAPYAVDQGSMQGIIQDVALYRCQPSEKGISPLISRYPRNIIPNISPAGCKVSSHRDAPCNIDTSALEALSVLLPPKILRLVTPL
ncbi:hypothetical protein AB1N83_006685 [Pleurotus pulmonarius]